ncbi:MAG: HAMP domain-containing histidine kinase [Anaerolineae bacterium]|nr:HAMP domain-containing histidine kinase [Anaerolineae bacterium]
MMMNSQSTDSALRIRVVLVALAGLVLTTAALVLSQQANVGAGGFFVVGAVSSPLVLIGILALTGRTRSLQQITPSAQQASALPLRLVLDAAPEAMVFSVDGVIQYANTALYRLFEQPDASPVDVEMLQRLLRSILAQRGEVSGEYKLRRVDGTEFDASVMTAGIPGQGRGALVAIIRDITHEKDVLAQKSRMLTNAASELRTPLANFKTRLYLIRRQPEKLAEHLDVVEEITEQMQHMIEDMLEVARFERGVVLLDRHNMVLQTIVRDAVDSSQGRAERRSVRLVSKMPEHPLKVFVDARRIKQLVSNLVSNAMNHTPEGGVIEVEVTARRSENPDYPHYALIHVRDNGVGIAPDLLTQVFQPFEAAAQGSTVVTGTALGLSLAKEIAELHGGEITVTSEAGKGSTFSVKLLMTEA